MAALPARRVFIPKPGGEELRPLSIPAVRDRIVQAAARIVVEPIFEADMLECSFGFRPRRSAHDALQVLVDEAWGGRRWVAESDIANCFEAIPHSGLMSAIEERIVDRQVLKLLRAMLRAGVMEDRAIRRSGAGTPQGGVISPCLCNVYLHRLDRQWAERGHGVLVRYADDMRRDVPNPSRRPSAPLRRCGRSCRSWGSRSRTPRRGSCSCAKAGRGWTFSASITAGCAAIRPPHGISASSPAGPHARPCSAPATGSVSSRTGAGCWCRVDEVVQDVNRFLRGWAGYFRYGNSARQFDKITHHALGPPRAVHGQASQAQQRATGWWIVIYQSPDRLGLISLDGTIVAPRPNRPWRPGR